MSLEIFRVTVKSRSKRYTRRRQWLGLTLGDILDRTADIFPTRRPWLTTGTG